MMRRTTVSLLLLVMASAASMGTASAQQSDYPPGTTAPGPPASVGPPFIESGSFTPGTRQNLGIAAAAIQQGRRYGGTLRSTPVALPSTVAASAGSIVFADVLIPADFALGANHSITVVDEQSGAVVAVSNFYVTADGKVLSTASGAAGSGSGSGAGSGSGGSAQRSSAGGLPRTGSDNDMQVKLGIGLVAAGGLAVLAVRRRREDVALSS
jgi:LPXTG-motif cell wall-anchored protein